jgi:hypothetical protein
MHANKRNLFNQESILVLSSAAALEEAPRSIPSQVKIGHQASKIPKMTYQISPTTATKLALALTTVLKSK